MFSWWTATQLSTSTTATNQNFTCYICGKPGHLAKNCYKNNSTNSNNKLKVSVRHVTVQEESLINEDEDNNDNMEEEANVEENQETGDVLKSGEEEEEDESESILLKPSPDIDTFFLFTKPSDMGLGSYQ